MSEVKWNSPKLVSAIPSPGTSSDIRPFCCLEHKSSSLSEHYQTHARQYPPVSAWWIGYKASPAFDIFEKPGLQWY